MAYYRLYFLDGGNRHIRTFRAFEAPDDGAAVALVERWRGVHPMELWCGGRKVMHWAGLGLARPSPRPQRERGAGSAPTPLPYAQAAVPSGG